MKYSTIFPLLTTTGLLLLASCQGPQPPKAVDPAASPSNIVATPSSSPITIASPPPTTKPSDAPVVAQEPPKAKPIPSPATPFKTATSSQNKSLNIYKADAQCNGLFPEKVELPGPADANAAVGQVIANNNSPDFRVVNYRVNVENGTATVDLRLPANAKRPFSALSACEQLEFFGSMEKTLTSNPSLQVRSVRFRDGQKELQF
jgi:hypothetical protein